MTFVGIDVGGRRKGFHAAAVDGQKVVKGPNPLRNVNAVLSWLEDVRPKVVALDSPMTCASLEKPRARGSGS